MRRRKISREAATGALFAASRQPLTKMLARRMKLDKGRAKCFRLLGEARFAFKGGEFSEALRLCNRARAHMPANLPISLRAEFFEIAHTSLAAIGLFEQELSRLWAEVDENPGCGEARFALACRLDALGRWEEALKEYQQVLPRFDTISPECQRDCLNNLGWIHFRNRDFCEAISWFDLALAVHDPTNPGPDTHILLNRALAAAELRRELQQASPPKRHTIRWPLFLAKSESS
jgi:tetratricopeptide (TPR) repeat protein